MVINDKFKICATCKHFLIEKTGREFENILDTEYNIYKCLIRGWTTREDFLMAPVKTEIEEMPPFNCEYWEEWVL
jgi:hypothetical protein